VEDQQNIKEDIEGEEDEDVADLPAVDSTLKKESTEGLQPVYETEDGSTAAIDEEGNTVVIDPATGEPRLAHDTVIYVSETDAKAAMAIVGSGQAHLTLNAKGEPVIVPTTENGQDEAIPVRHSTTPAPGMYAIPVSAQRGPNKLQNVRPMGTPRKIKTVFPSRSMGAAGPETTVTQKETTFSRRLAATEGLAGPMAATGEKGIFYTPLTTQELDVEARSHAGNTLAEMVDYLESPIDKGRPFIETKFVFRKRYATSLKTFMMKIVENLSSAK